MGDKTKIQWTDATWNPLRGCSRVSDGCRNCYAESVAHRFSGPGLPYERLTRVVNGRPAWTGEARLVPEMLDQPLRWSRPRRIFVNSMSGLFHGGVSGEFIARGSDARRIPELRGGVGTVVLVGKPAKGAPRNHAIEINGIIYTVPAGNLRLPKEDAE